MSDNPELNYRINLKEGDKSAEKALERYAKAAEKASKAFGIEGQKKIQQELNRLRETGVQVIEREEQRQRNITRELERQEQIRRSFSTQAAGDLSSGLSATRALTSTLGGGGALTGALELGDDAFQLIEYLPRLRDGLGQLATSAAAAVGGFGPLGLAIGAAALAVGGLALAYNEFTKDAQRNAELMERNLDATLDLYRRAAEGATSQEIQADIDKLNKRREAELVLLGKLQAQYDATYNAADKVVSADEERDFLFIEELRKSTQNAEQDINGLTTALERGLFAANDAAAEEQKLADARKKSLDVITQLETQQRQLIATYQAQQRVLAENRALQDDRRAEDDAIKAARAERDLTRQLALEADAQQKRLLGIAQQGAKQLIDLERATADRRAQAAKQIARVQADFERERAKAEERFARDRQRALRDQRDAELDAFIENDVTALILGRRRFGRSEADAREDFDIDRAERAEALRIRIDEINAELAEFQQAQAVKRAEIQAQTAAEIELAKAEYAEKQRLDEETREIRRRDEEEDRQLARSRLEEDRRIEDRRAVEQLEKQLGDIESKRSAEVAALIQVLLTAKQIEEVARVSRRHLGANTPYAQYTAAARTGGVSSAPPLPMANTNPYFTTPLPPPASSGGMTINLSNNAFGNVATTETVNAVVKAIQQGITLARSLG